MGSNILKDAAAQVMEHKEVTQDTTWRVAETEKRYHFIDVPMLGLICRNWNQI